MPEFEDTQRSDRLLDAMVKKPPLDVGQTQGPEAEDDLRGEDEG